MKRILTVVAALFTASQAQGLECPDGFPIGAHIGVPVESGRAFYETEELLRVNIAWLPGEGRHRYQENVRVDWQARTHSQVDVWDGESGGYSEFGIREVELLESTNFDTGHLDIRFCMPAFEPERGLVFAFLKRWENPGKDPQESGIETLVMPFRYQYIPEGLWFTAVLEPATSDLVESEFNRVTADNVTADVAATTGVEPPRYLAESLIQQNLQPTADLVTRDHAPFFDLRNANLVGNRVVVTGDDASLAVTHGVRAVRHQGQNVLGPDDRVTGLEHLAGAISYDWHSQPRMAHVVDGRADIEVSATACTDGTSTITGRFTGNPALAPRWLVTERTLVPAPATRESGFNTETVEFEASCDSDFEINASLEPGGGTARAHVRFTDPEPLFIKLRAHCRSTGIFTCTQKTRGGLPAPETLRKIWDVEDLSGLRGDSHYACSDRGDGTVDSIDEIVERINTVLSDEEIAALQIVRDSPMVLDDDGDGTVCNVAEKGLGEGQEVGYFYWIQLEVRDNLGHPDFRGES
ncbi:MAG: hypothetical protein GWM87_15270 [Xanthomonadales bacterium]|nr:hypothetical protein [Xanthomonadales bacterium]NIX14147.1 hypothetical protein [Xanthomonadales bacterium]